MAGCCARRGWAVAAVDCNGTATAAAKGRPLASGESVVALPATVIELRLTLAGDVASFGAEECATEVK